MKRTIEDRWLSKNGKIGSESDHFRKYVKSEKTKLTDIKIVCSDCGWEPNSVSSLEASIHAFLYGHTVVKTVTYMIRVQNDELSKNNKTQKRILQ